MSALQLRGDLPVEQAESAPVRQSGGDPLSAVLRACSAIGEQALSSADCQAAWAQKRRRFLGIETEEAQRNSDLPEKAD
jgi:conjugative transfer region protein TrbK